MNRKIGVILSYVLMIFEVLSTLLLTPYMLSTLGQAEYGVYRLSGTIVAYLLLLDLGVGNASIRFFSKYRANNDIEQSRKFLGVSIIYYSAIAMIALTGGIVLIAAFPTLFAQGLNASETALGQTLLSITVLTSVITLLTSPFYSSLIAYEKFTVSRGVSILQIILRIAFTFIALWLGMGSVGIVIIHLIMTLIGRGFFVYYCFAKLKIAPVFKGFNFSFIKEIVVYSSFILLQMIATQINAGLGQILLGALVSSSAVIIGIYSIGTQIVQYFQSIGSSVTGVLMPGIVAMVEKKATPKQLCAEMVRIGRIILSILALIWVAFLLFGKQFIILWAGTENTNAFFVAIILLTVYMFILTESVGSQILWALNQHKEQAIIKIVMVVLNILLTYFLIKSNALLGATLGTFIALLLGDLVAMNIVFKRKIKISFIEYYKGLFKGILPCIVVTLALGWLFSLLNLQGWIGFICNGVFVTVIFTASMLLFGFNSYEKNLIFGIFKKVFRRTGK